MDDEKKQELVKKCIEWTKEAEDSIACPVCYETKRVMVQCVVGHHICESCRNQVGNSCPTCKAGFTGTKIFLIEDISKMLSNVKLSLNDLDKNAKVVQLHGDNKNEYRKLIDALLTRVSTFCNQTSNTMNFFSKYLYLQNPNHSDKNELERQLLSLTSQFQNLRHLMDDTKNTLVSLKK